MNANIKKNMVWNALGNVVYLGCQWLVTILVTRLLGYEVAGVLSLAMSISASFQTLALFGIRNFQVSDIKNQYSDSCYVGFRNITCLLALALCILFALVNKYNTNTIISIVLFMLFRLAEDYSDVLHGIFQKNDKLYMAGQSFFIRGFAVLIGFIAGYRIFRTLNGGLAVMTIVSICISLFFDLPIAIRLSDSKFFINIKNCLILAKETWLLCAYMFLGSVIVTAPKYILEKMASEEILGVYSSIFAPALLIQAATQYIYMPFISKLSIMFNDHDTKGFRALSNKIVTTICVIGLLILAICILLGEWCLKLLFTDSIAPYSDMLYLIIVGVFCHAVNVFYQALAVIVRSIKGLVVSCIIGVIVSCGVSAVAINIFSADGASMGLIAGTLLAALVLYICIDTKAKKVQCSAETNKLS